jgi:hypothetical protein
MREQQTVLVKSSLLIHNMNNKYWGCIFIARGLQVFQRAKSYLHILSTIIPHFKKLGLAAVSRQHNHNISNGVNAKSI